MKSEPVVILLAEDEPAHIEAIRRAFEAAGTDVEIQVSGTLREYRESVAARAPDIALVDLNLPDGRAVEVLTSPPEAGPFPILIITGYGNEQVAVEAMRSGALDYIVKSPEAFADLPRTVVRALREWNVLQERKRAEDNLRESEEKFRAIFDNALDGILLADAENRKVHMGNDAICRMLGYSPEEIKNLWIVDIHPEKDLHYVMYQYEEKAEGGLRLSGDLPIKRKDGNVFYADIKATTIKIAGKACQIVFFRDVTEMRLAEEERRRASELKTAIEIKSKFTSMVSHELRSPLATIKEGINIVLEGLAGNVNDEQKDLLNTAKRNADRLGRLINNVLDFQKIESGKMKFDIRENDIYEVTREVSKAMSPLAKQKALDLVVDADNGLPKIRFDRDRIIQVFTNLLSNAIKFTEKGSISISMKQEDNVMHVIVQDTGVGIKAEDMPRVFQAFEQLDTIEYKKKSGTGLGLAICKEIILAHKGKIWAESEVGKGTAFHFALPIKERRG